MKVVSLVSVREVRASVVAALALLADAPDEQVADRDRHSEWLLSISTRRV